MISDLPISNNQIAINANAKTPYVVYKGSAAPNPTVNWGEGTQVKDPGFNSGNLNAWTVAGNDTSVERNPSGQYELKIGSGSGTTVSQQITGLSEGKYYASVYVSTSNGRKAYIGVNNYGGPEVSNYADSSLWSNYIQADSKRDTNMQRMYLFFDVPAGSTTATLYLKADSGTSTATFDDVRIGKTVKTPNPDGAYFVQDFEHALQGWYPFVKGPAGGTNDPRTHLSELHSPYTQKGWNGKAIDDVISGNYSLKAYKESSGLLYQTIPQMVRFIPGTTYTVKFKYESAASDYAFVIGDSTTIQSTTTLKEASSPETFKAAFVASSSGQSWFGIKKKAGATDFVMDELVITLGGDPSQNIPTDQSTIDPNKIPHSQMTATATDAETENEDNGPSNVLDDDESTIWHTRWDNSNQFPQSITLNLGGTFSINQIKYLPRQSGKNGMITNYNLYTSTDGINFTTAASGTWDTDAKEKSVVFTSTSAAYVKLEATKGYNGWASAAEINVFKESLPVVAIAGGTGTVTVQNAVYGASLKLYDSLKQTVASLTATGTAADQFTGVPAGVGYYVTQTVNGVESAPSNAVSVTAVPKVLGTVLTAPNSVLPGGTFTVTFGLEGVTENVYAQDIKMDFNSSVLEFVSVTSAREGISLLETVKDVPGKLRFIVASTGAEQAVKGDEQVLVLTFKAKQVAVTSTGTVSVTSAALAGGTGVEKQAAISSVHVEVTVPQGTPGDINHDGKVSIGDLALAAVNYGKTSSDPNWQQIKAADTNGDNKIDIMDLAAIASKITE